MRVLEGFLRTLPKVICMRVYEHTVVIEPLHVCNTSISDASTHTWGSIQGIGSPNQIAQLSLFGSHSLLTLAIIQELYASKWSTSNRVLQLGRLRPLLQEPLRVLEGFLRTLPRVISMRVYEHTAVIEPFNVCNTSISDASTHTQGSIRGVGSY